MKKLMAWLEQLFSRVELTLKDFHDYQFVAADFLYSNAFSALFLDTGLGKTPVLLYLIKTLIYNEEAKRVLIIGPRRVVSVTWPDEIAKWDFSAPLTYTIIRDEELTEQVSEAGRKARHSAKVMGHDKAVQDAISNSARDKEAKRAVRQMLVDKPAFIYLIHKEQVEFLVNAFGRDWPFDVVIIDESSSLKDSTTNRWKALWKVRLLIKRMHQLTATPAAETYMNLFAQITLLDLAHRFGKSYNKFQNKYFSQNKYNMKWTIRDGAEQEIVEKISDICLVMKQEDYLDLQQPVLRKHNVYLDQKQKDLYETMENESIIQLGDDVEIEAETAAALSQKLLQMASGVIYQTVMDDVGDGNFKKRRVVHHLHDHKIDALRQLEEEVNGESLLVAYYHKSSLERLQIAFPHAVAMDEKGKCIAKWNKGKIKMLLIHPQSDAHGLNLQKGGRHVVFFDAIWSYENYYQMYRRLARQGQELLVIIHMLIAIGTKDEIVAQCLVEKRDAQEDLFKAIMAKRAKLRRQQLKLINSDI